MSGDGPAALAEFQRWFSSVLRTPLDPSSLTFAISPDAWPTDAEAQTTAGGHGTTRQRLAVYNRQYWLRLFTTFGKEFPLVARLLGFFRLNQLAQSFLLERAPRGFDLGQAPDGFDVWLDHLLARPDVVSVTPPLPDDLDRDALRQAAAIDGAFRALWVAPHVPPFRPTHEDAARLPSSLLLPSPSVALVDEGWALLALRRALAADTGEGSVPLPNKHDHPRTVALVRLADGLAELPLDALQAQLYRALPRVPLSDALAQLAAAAPADRVDALPADVQRWLRWSVELGFWRGIA